MKVVQINAVCSVGSTGRICRQLNDAIMERGHAGAVLYGNACSDYPHAWKVSGKLGVKAHGLMSRVLGKNAAYSPFATRKILGFLKAYQPDVVHLHNLHGNYVNLKLLLRYLVKEDIPTVLTLHDCWFFTGKCTHYTTEGCYKWQTGCHDCPRLRGDIPSYFFDRTKEMWNEKKTLLNMIPRLAVIGVSDWITNEARKSFLSTAKITERIYNWLDLERFYPREGDLKRCFGISEDKFSILCIGAGWTASSARTKDLLALAKQLGEEYEIILAGSISFADRLPQNIKYVGYVSSSEELAQLYSACDVYVHLSREDTFGKVIAEAMACGTPVVVYNATACPEVVGNGCGYVVETGDISAVLDAVKCVAHKGKRAYSKACTEFVKSNFAKDTLIDETIKLYDDLCKMDKKCR